VEKFRKLTGLRACEPAQFSWAHALVVLAHVARVIFLPRSAGWAPLSMGERFSVLTTTRLQPDHSHTVSTLQKFALDRFNWRFDSGLVASNPNLDNFGDASISWTPINRRPSAFLRGCWWSHAYGFIVRAARPGCRDHLRRESSEDSAKLINIAGPTLTWTATQRASNPATCSM